MKLLEPIMIRDLEVRNRVIMAAMTTRLASPDGYVTEELIAYYEARARGGVGLVTVELSSPHPSGAHRRREVGIHHDRFLPGLRRLADAVHRHGAGISIQIGHAGAHARPDVTGYPAVAPGDVPHTVQEGDVVTVRPRPLTSDEIDEMVGWYAAAAERMRRAGFDAVELQGGHDYLIFQFLSPLDNNRTDGYGGDLDNRSRFALEIVAACRARAPELPLSFRFSAHEYAEGGFTQHDAVRLVPELVDAGVDLINVSAGSARSEGVPWLICTPMAYPRAMFVEHAEAIKATVGVPVAVAGRIDSHDLAEQILAGGSADLVTLGRPLLADPSWAAKAAGPGRRPVKPCIACNTCVDHLRSGRQVQCLVNPTIGRESQPAASTADEQRAVIVVGGGPAGLTAARELARRGHDVTLHEAGPHLGGRLLDIHRAPFFQVVETSADTFERLVEYLIESAAAAGAKLVTDSPVTAEGLITTSPDAVVVATGAVYPVPGMLRLLDVPGARALASTKRMRKLFFNVLRTRDDGMPSALAAAGIETHVIGDRSGSRGVEAAIAAGHRAAGLL